MSLWPRCLPALGRAVSLPHISWVRKGEEGKVIQQIRQQRDKRSMRVKRCCRGWIRICRSPPLASSTQP
ncbi:hypothetical protein NQZ68_013983 [Dissostichus eleginoides]|nr:hypothetical protein NQZ68_013983 [Dissostichus eleginoides]